jgi:NAD(P)-dependent dehydrogenase (short-subunit alcohol dehydrogenase family)
MRLQDRIALVTGGGQGIGRAIARVFAREGARVAIAARTAEKLAKVQGEIEALGAEVLAVPTDVGRDEDMGRLFTAVQDRFGGLDVLVNNAGVGLGAPVDQVDMKDYHRLMDTNVKGMYLGCKLGVPMMKAAGQGSIVNISSVHGVDGSPMNTVYAATKGGIIGCTRALAAELAPFKIRVNTISPGAIWLERDIDAWLAPLKPEYRQEAVRLFGEKLRDNHRYFQPLQVVGETDDIAYCALYLASEESRFVTGQNIVVDGGLTTYLSGYAKEGAREAVRASDQEMRAWFEAHKA